MKTFTITLTEQDLNVIGVALGDAPYKAVIQTIQSINQQINTPKPEVVEGEDA